MSKKRAFAEKEEILNLISSPDTSNKGVSLLKKKARKGDADSMYLLAKIYERKYNDPQKAFYWCKKAAQSKHLYAMIEVGVYYYRGYGVQKSHSKAIKWYKTAADLNFSAGYYNLGLVIFLSEKDDQKALNYFKKAYDMKYADAAYILGAMYLLGRGVEKNTSTAKEYLIKSVEFGKYYACRPIGDFYYAGEFDNNIANPSKALEWYEEGAARRDISCIHALGDWYYQGMGGKVDIELSSSYYQLAMKMGSAYAPYMLARILISKEDENPDVMQIRRLLKIAASRGNEQAPDLIKTLDNILGMGTPAVPQSNSDAGASGINITFSSSDIADEVNAEYNARKRMEKERNAGITAAAGAMAGDGSYVDWMGNVIDENGEVTIVNADLGIIIGPKGDVSSYNFSTGETYTSDGDILMYDHNTNTTRNTSTGKISFHYNGYTSQ